MVNCYNAQTMFVIMHETRIVECIVVGPEK